MTLDGKKSVDGLLAEAAAWHASIDCGTADRPEFERWRLSDPRNAAAFARLSGTDETLTNYGAELARRPSKFVTITPLTRRQFFQIAAGIGAATIGAWSWGLLDSRAHASTVVGEQKTIRLPDGSSLSLNTDSKASWKFDGKRRNVWLERGEIGVLVVAERGPLTVRAGQTEMHIFSGNLNARLRDKMVDVSVLQGTCMVSKGTAKPRQINQGQAALSGGPDISIRELSPNDLQFNTGWRGGQIVFEGQTLGVAVEEYNRYLKDKIIIADSDIASVRLGGRFNTHDPEDFLASLESAFGIHATRGSTGEIVLTR